MNIERNTYIDYEGKQINIFSDERDDYINITEMAIAWRGRKSIRTWMRNTAALGFLAAWERKHNPNFLGAQMDAKQIITERDDISIKNWIDKTNAIGIFTKTGVHAGTYAHKDIAIKFAAWLDPDFELFIIEKVQELRTLEEKKNSYDLLSHEQILYLIRLKEVFKFVAHQNLVESAHKDVFAAKSSSTNSFAEFHQWRNKILDIAPQTINDRIRQYCIDNHIALTNTMLKRSKQEKILFLDSYESVRNAVWDFLNIKGEVNALNLANLVGDIIRTEKGEVLRKNEDNLFSSKQYLGEFTEFKESLNAIPILRTARQVLEYREKNKNGGYLKSDLDKSLKALMNVPPPKKEK